MSFEIKLQTSSSDREHLDKELTDVVTLTGSLREDCDVRDPVILLDTTLDALAAVNYFTIPALGRSYFLTSAPRLIRTGLVEIGGHCDVLSSFAAGIRAQTAIIQRAESSNAYNLYLNDGSLKTYQNPYVLTEPFPAGFTGASFVLAVAGSAGS